MVDGLNSVFDDIGREKENIAKAITEQQRKEAEEAKKKSFFNHTEMYGDDVDLDEEERKIEEEMERVRRGTPIPIQGTGESEELTFDFDDEPPGEPELAKDQPLELDLDSISIVPEGSDPAILQTKDPSSIIKRNMTEAEKISAATARANIDITFPANAPSMDEDGFSFDTETIEQTELAAEPNALQDNSALPEDDIIEDEFDFDEEEVSDNGSSEQATEDEITLGFDLEELEQECAAETFQKSETPDIEFDIDVESEPVEERAETDIPVIAEILPDRTTEEKSADENNDTDFDEIISDVTKTCLYGHVDKNGNNILTYYVETRDGERSLNSESYSPNINWDTAVFSTAIKLLTKAESANSKTILIVAPKDIAVLLKNNAAYGITGEYSEECVEYIELARKLSMKKSVRIISQNEKDSEIMNNAMMMAIFVF